MSDNNNVPTQQTPAANQGNQGDNGTQRTFTQDQLDAIIADRLTRERQKYQDYDALKTDAEAYRQIKQNEMSELDRAREQLEKLEAAQNEANAYKNALQNTLEKRLETVPAEWKAAVPDYGDPVKTLGWLDANQHLWVQRKAPNLNAGTPPQGGGSPLPKLSALEIEMAKNLGMTPEKYAQNKAAIAKSVSAPDDDDDEE